MRTTTPACDLGGDRRLRRVDDLGRELDPAVDRAGVHQELARLQPAAVDLVALGVLAQRGHEGLGHALALHPQRVDHVGVGEAVVEVVGDVAAERLDPARDQRGRAAHRHLGAELAEGEDVRAGHARVRDVADDPDRAPLERAELVPQRVDVEQRLGRVLVLAVARVDDRRRGPARDQLGGAHVRGADHDGGRVVGRQGLDGVLERLALVDRRAGAAHRDDVGAQALGGQLEARRGAGGGLVEEVDHGAAAQRRDLLDLASGDLGERVGAVEDALDLVTGQGLDGEQMPHASASWGWVMVTSSMPSSSSTRTLTRSARAVGRFLPT